MPYLTKDKLIVGRWYRGKGRNSNIALWDGMAFLTFGNKFGHYVEKQESHWDDEGPFQPQEELPC